CVYFGVIVMSVRSFVKPAANRRNLPAWLLVSLLALAVSACGGSDDDSQSGIPPVATPPPVETIPPAEDLPEPAFEPAPDANVKPLPRPDGPSLPPPPAELRLSATYNKSSLAQPIRGITASSSGDEN